MFNDFVVQIVGQLWVEFFIFEVVDELIKIEQVKVSVFISEDCWYGVIYKEDKLMVVVVFEKLLVDGVYLNKLWQIGLCLVVFLIGNSYFLNFMGSFFKSFFMLGKYGVYQCLFVLAGYIQFDLVLLNKIGIFGFLLEQVDVLDFQ